MQTSNYAAARYVDILTDGGFKAVFGDAANKQVVMDFLNAILPEGRKIHALEYSTTEIPGVTLANKSVRLDLRCTAEDGTSFIIEMQRYSQNNFFKRCVSYASKVYTIHSERGDRHKYDIPPVYMIGILGKDFSMEPKPLDDKYTFYYEFREKDTGRVVCETISIIFVELRHFNKPLSECKTIVEKWCYCLKNIGSMDRLPAELQEEVFKRFFEAAEIAKFDPDKREKYISEMFTQDDYINEIETARENGEKKGLEAGRAEGEERKAVEVAKAMKGDGMSCEQISKFTGLTKAQIEEL
ncbi:MAG: Rpn family recombination-promoting nuclease/putative transposase [Bacteroidales bacterium]|nr:Rpn family recombination-promoting nuclease/putative transposase [Bacteroidales bacterium]